MEIKSKLMQKIGIMSANLSNEFIQLDVDDRIPTVAFLSEKYETARGTVQSSLKLLQDYGAIKLESRGHLGTFITYRLSEIIRSSRDKFISWSYAITILKKI